MLQFVEACDIKIKLYNTLNALVRQKKPFMRVILEENLFYIHWHAGRQITPTHH